MFYPDLDGNGRADLHAISGTFTNQATSSLNPSCDAEDQSDGSEGGEYDPEPPSTDGGESAEADDDEDNSGSGISWSLGALFSWSAVAVLYL